MVRPKRLFIVLLAAILLIAGGGAGRADDDKAIAALRAAFQRPAAVPFPADNAFSEDKRALGEALFRDRRLSGRGDFSCADCHDPARNFADGKPRAAGVSKRPLGRHTPTLWNLAFSGTLFWDGRARTLEEQVAGPLTSPDEMGGSVDRAVAAMAADAAMVASFARAFPEHPVVDWTNLTKAIATFERTLVAPMTAFDRWADGDDAALDAREKRGFALFAGKAGCARCHTGFAFSDWAFHDTGLPGRDRGRGAVLGFPPADHAFRTPSLRQAAATAPYMHDGSLPTLEAVLRHYESGGVRRATRSRDLPPPFRLTDGERADMLAFLHVLSAPTTAPAPVTASAGPPLPAGSLAETVVQHHGACWPNRLALKAGGRLWLVNNDRRSHAVGLADGADRPVARRQRPGEVVSATFPRPGTFMVKCGNRPDMKLRIDVTP